MSIVTLDDQKAHLGVTLTDDDDLISGQIDAAQAHLESLLGYEIETEFGSGIPADLSQAVMMLAAHYFENREAVLVGVNGQELPMGVWETVSNRRNYSWSDPVA